MRTIILAACAVFGASTVWAQLPVNDEPSGATPIYSGHNVGPTFTTKWATKTVGYPVPPCGAPESDVWFLFTPTVGGAHLLHTAPAAGWAPGSLRDSVLSVYDASLSTILACDDDSAAIPSPDNTGAMSLVSLNLFAGVPIFVRISVWGSDEPGTFSITVVDSNYNNGIGGCATCAAATPITDGLWHGQLNGATASGAAGAGCPNFSASTFDLWYLYTPVVTGPVNVFVEGAAVGSFGLAVYDLSAGCGAPVVASAACGPWRNTHFFATAFGAYAIRVGAGSAATTDVAGLFSLTVATIPTTSNDSCANAMILAEGDNLASVVGATSEPSIGAACPGFLTSVVDVWGTFTTPAAGRVKFSAWGWNNLKVLVYSGACGSLTLVGCDGGSPSYSDLVGGTTYYVRVYFASFPNPSTANLAVNFVPFPANDECVGALPIPFGVNVGLDNFGATSSPSSPQCQTAHNDVWYSFVAPKSGTIRISGCGSSSDPFFAVYASCGGALLACDDDDANNAGPCATTTPLMPFIRMPVSAGTTYLLRVGANSATHMAMVVTLLYEYSFNIGYDAPTSTVVFDAFGGSPGAQVVHAVTPFQGAFPNGWFYGVDIPLLDLYAIVVYGSPFVGVLDAAGELLVAVPGVPQIGTTFYYASVALTPGGQFGASTIPGSVTLL
jgi:hypothetical protein